MPRKGKLGPRRMELATAAERALELALARAGHQVTFREIAAAWRDANGAVGVQRGSTSWLLVFEPGVAAGRVLVTRPSFLPYYTLRDGPPYDLPDKHPSRFSARREEWSAAAERAIAIALARHGHQVVWSEVEDVWGLANGGSSVPPTKDRGPELTEPGRISGRVIMTFSHGRTFFTLACAEPHPIVNPRAAVAPVRAARAAEAERALRLALSRAGCHVRWEQIHAAWEEANGTPAPRSSANFWNWASGPLRRDGLIVKSGGARRRCFAFRDGPQFPPPPPQWGVVRLAGCAAGERALELALRRAGQRVSWKQIGAAWGDANGSSEMRPRDKPAAWSYLFKPAVEAGRVVVTRTQPAYYTLRDGPEYSIPDSRVRRGRTDRVSTRLSAAAVALAVAAGTAGEMVDSTQVHEAWERATGAPAGCNLIKVRRALDLLVTEGRARLEVRNGRSYFAPPERPELKPPRYTSDRQRVYTALVRASARLGSAVLYKEVEREVQADPDLHLHHSIKLLRNYVASLCAAGRAIFLPSPQGVVRRTYFSPKGGPRWVTAAAEHPQDRRFRAVMGLWKAGGGRPFTTPALRRYASSRRSLRFENDGPLAWTNALHRFDVNGDVVRICIPGARLRRWAPAAEWNALSAAEREERLRDLYRCGDGDESDELNDLGLNRRATVHDVGYESRTRNIRYLVLVAKAMRVEGEQCPERRRVLRDRPVTSREIRVAAIARPGLGVAPEEVVRAVAEALHVMKASRWPAVVVTGTACGLRYVDVCVTPGGAAYVAYLQASRAASPREPDLALRRLRAAWDRAISGVVPLPRAVLEARAQQLAQTCRETARALLNAARPTELLAEERADVLDRVSEFRRLARDVSGLSGTGMAWRAGCDLVEGHTLLPDDAARQIEGLYGRELVSPAMVTFLFVTVGRIPAGEGENEVRKARGRALRQVMDRVGFACYSAARWGGPSLASLAQQAGHAMGLLRTPAPFISSLLDPGMMSAHAPMAAVLGFFDDAISRAALTEYLDRHLDGGERVGVGTTLVAAETSVIGLAPLPFGGLARALTPRERAALERAAGAGLDERLRHVASRVLRAWDELWERDQLLRL